MTALHQLELTCPICDTRFSTKAVLTTNSFGGKRTDFHERAAGAQPLPYYVHVCRECGYAGKERAFGEDAVDLWAVAPKVKEHLSPRVKDGTPLTGSEKYEMAAKVAEWRGADHLTLADLNLRAAWCCVDEGDVEAERYFRRLSARAYDAALALPDAVEPAQRAVLTYLVGELWRRVGDRKLAAEWFDRVEHEVVDATGQQWCIDAAKQQRDCPREWFG